MFSQEAEVSDCAASSGCRVGEGGSWGGEADRDEHIAFSSGEVGASGAAPEGRVGQTYLEWAYETGGGGVEVRRTRAWEFLLQKRSRKKGRSWSRKRAGRRRLFTRQESRFSLRIQRGVREVVLYQTQKDSRRPTSRTNGHPPNRCRRWPARP